MSPGWHEVEPLGLLALDVVVFLNLITQKPLSLGSLAGPLATGEAAAASDAELWISHGSSQLEGQQLGHWTSLLRL